MTIETISLRSHRAGLGAASLIASLAVHSALLAAVLAWSNDRPGAIEAETEAISVELYANDVIEAVEALPQIDTAASPSSVQSTAGQEYDSASTESVLLDPQKAEAQLAATEAPPELEVREEDPQGHSIVHGAHEDAVPEGDETEKISRKPQTPKPAEPPKPNRPAKLAKQEAPHAVKAPASRKGGAQSRATLASAASPGRVSASTGSAINYAATVRARVAAQKPGGAGLRGTVVVSFGISKSGGLAFAGIAHSSGDSSLDGRVLSAVRGAAPFPAPPPGASARFAIPFYFR